MDWGNLVADETRILTRHYTAGRDGHSIDKVIVHHNDGDLSVEGAYDVWQTREASAHYQVTSDGTVGQLVWDRDTAWHAGNWRANQTSIGIEHADCSRSPYRISEACLDSGAHLVAAVCRRYGLGRPEWGRNLFGHSDFAPTECPASLAVGGSQHDAYVARAQAWYDAMCAGAGTLEGDEKPTIEEVEEMAATGLGIIVNPQNAISAGHAGGLYRVTADRVYHYTNADQPRADDILSQALCGEPVPRLDMAGYGSAPWFDRMVQARGGWNAVVDCPAS